LLSCRAIRHAGDFAVIMFLDARFKEVMMMVVVVVLGVLVMVMLVVTTILLDTFSRV